MGNRPVFTLSIIAILVVAVSVLAWYHREFYDKRFGTVSASSMNMKTDDKSKDVEDPSVKDKDNKVSSGTDLALLIAKLQIPDAKREKVVTLIAGLNAEVQTTTQSLDELFQQNLKQPSDFKDNLHLLQQGFNIKLEQFKLDLSDEIGDAQTEKVMEVIREITPPVLLEDVSAPSASHGGMAGMDM